jgi:ABC-type Fe3+-hydroxamate transport system substrate-binding protein
VRSSPLAATSSNDSTRDDFGDVVSLDSTPHRIVSLDPATTELLFALGAGDRLVGRTRWDSYPPAVQSIPSVGDGLSPNIEVVLAQHPDLVVLYATGADRAADQAFRAAGVSTLAIRIDRISQFERASMLLGRVLHDTARARVVVDSVRGTIDRIHELTKSLPHVRVVWPVELSPIRVIGGGSYLTDLVTAAGGDNVFGETVDPAPVVSLEEVLQRRPEVVLTTPSGARSLDSDPRWARWIRERGHRVLVPDTALVGMPSVRMGEATRQLATLLHPGLKD